MAIRVVFEDTLEVWDIPNIISIPENRKFKVVLNSAFMGEVKQSIYITTVTKSDYYSRPGNVKVRTKITKNTE